jgi:hypothetical protein
LLPPQGLRRREGARGLRARAPGPAHGRNVHHRPPEESPESLERTLELAFELELDFMSLNMAVPRFGTPFRAQALELGLAQRDDLVMDQGGAQAFLPTRTLDREAMLALKKRMVRRFYLRPSYLWRRMRSVKSLWELRAQAREGWSLLMRNV